MQNKERITKIITSTKKTVILVFFTLNVSIMVVAGFPDQSALGMKFLDAVGKYQALVMLYQPWAMFAPNPMNTTVFIEADLTFEDGSTSVWKMPRAQDIKGIRKVLTADRYRILGQETLLPNQNDLVWFDLSRYITREVLNSEAKESGRILKGITFKRFYSRVLVPPEAPMIPHGTLSSSFNVENVFRYTPAFERIGHEAKNNY